MKKTILVFVGLLGLGSLVWIPQVRSQAADSTAAFTISDIRVEGLQRISAGTVFNYLPAGVGSTISPADYAEIIRALFKTGFFTDISLARDGNVLVINVVERPSVAEINISGNKDISTDELLTALRDIGLAEGRVFDRALLDRIEQELINQYFGRGKYAAKLDVAVRTLPRNRVAIDLTVSEGVAARIRQINIVGNQDFDDDDLLDQFQLTTSGIITILTKSDQYSKQKLEADIEALRSFYLDRGYLRFNVNSTQVSISPDKKDIFITINITEGEPYTIRDVNLRGNLLVPEEELRGLITLQEGEVFSRSEANQVVQALADRFGEDGYAFAVINTIPNLDDATSQVDLTFAIDPGRRVYVRRINFTGNLKTNDDVLRREMRQAEGGWFSTKDIKRSQIRLQRLPYLADVQVDSQPVPGSPDQVDIDVAVEERNSGSLNVGLGYGQTEGFLFNAAVSQSNFLGTGNEVGFAFNNSDSDTLYSLTYNNPYYTPDGVSRGFRLSYRETDAGENNTADYVVDRLLGLLNYGFPLNEFDTWRVGAGLENLHIKTTESSPQEIFDYLDENGDDFWNIKLESSWSRDSRNRVIFPTEGYLNRVGLEVALPGSDTEYYKIDYLHRGYFPLNDTLTLTWRGVLGYGDGYGDQDALPFFENYFAGGLRTVRGFETNTLGPRYSNGEASGGGVRVVGGTEVISELPFLADSDNFRISAFFDIGNVFETPSDFDAGELRYSTGLSFMWISPLGPLALSYALPINDEDDDDVENFQFSFGVPF